MTSILEARSLRKSYGSIEVLHGVDFDLRPGEVHAIVGENGAGKSTLMKCLSGYLEPDGGEIRLGGEPVAFRNGAHAEDEGVVLIHQEFNLAEDLTVEENIFLGRELHRGPFTDRRAMLARTRELLDLLRTEIDPGAAIRHLSVSEMQMVEIAKAVSRDARILFMDEPTDVLTGNETEVLFELIRRLRDDGVAIVYVSHKLGEVMEIADRITILRDGEHIATEAKADLDAARIARLMVGRELSDMYPPKAAEAGAVVLEVEGFSVPGRVRDAAFSVRRGEVLAFAGLVGSGRTELFEGLFGLRPNEGTVRVSGEPVSIRHPEDAKQLGLAYLSEDRKGKGLITSMQLRPNLTLEALEQFATPLLDARKEQRALEQAVEEFDIRVPSLDALAGNLSGGNQQKLVLAKIMQTDPQVVVLDEPTRGIDVGTKRQIYFYIRELTRQGRACVLISSELPEVVGLADRVAVMRSGRITGMLEGDRIDEHEIVQYATGLKSDGGNHADAA
jgi:ribose transport system ATP-binding protein